MSDEWLQQAEPQVDPLSQSLIMPRAQISTTSAGFVLMEDGVSKILMENGVDKTILE